MTKPRPAFWLAFVASLLVPLAGFAQKKPKIIVVTHGQASDPFWLVVRNGVETAAKETGSDVEYQATGQFDLPAMSKCNATQDKAHARQLKGKDCTVRTFVPEGLSESSPVRSAGK
jgi:hypothetical protein